MNTKDVNLLEAVCYLQEIKKYAGKKQAAKEFGISLDTLNKYIEQLEQELGYRVLITNGKGSFLTQRGELLLEKTKELSQILNSIKQSCAIPKGIEGEVRIGMSSIAGSALLCKGLSNFFTQYPSLQIKHLIYRDAEFDDKKIAEVDLALTTRQPQNSDYIVIATQKVSFGFFASPQYISAHGYPQNLEDMLENHFIINKNDYSDYILDWENLLKQVRHVMMTTNTSHFLYDVVKNGGGIGIMPLRFKKEGLVHLENIPCQSNVSLYLVTHRTVKDIPKIRAIIDFYKEQIID